MKTIIILAKIITIIFVVKLESTRISYSERLYEFESIYNLKNKVIREYLSNYHLADAHVILDQYILNEVEMYGFAEHLNRTGMPPEWSKTRKLKNHEYYNFLRYNEYVEVNNMKLETALQINTLDQKIFVYLSNLNTIALYDFYNRHELHDLISYEDYCALYIFKNYNFQIYWENPASWRIRRALYSLAIRQYSSQARMNYIPKTCFFRRRETKTFVDHMKMGDSFKKISFNSCSSKYKVSYSFTSQDVLPNSFYWVNYKMLIMDPITIVSLKEIFDDDDEEIYVILPKVELTILSDPQFYQRIHRSYAYVTIAISPIYEKSNWLTEIANEIERSKEMESQYLRSLE